MGSVLSVVQRATEISGSSKKLYVLTAAEVAEDEAALEAQRASIRYCVDSLYYSAPVSISPVRTPTHHLPTALVTVDLSRDGADDAAHAANAASRASTRPGARRRRGGGYDAVA